MAVPSDDVGERERARVASYGAARGAQGGRAGRWSLALVRQLRLLLLRLEGLTHSLLLLLMYVDMGGTEEYQVGCPVHCGDMVTRGWTMCSSSEVNEGDL